MSGFSEQRGQLNEALLRAGFPRQSAESLVHILCNALQEMKHSGPVVQDTTPDQMRLVTPEIRKQYLTNLEFRGSDPDYRPPLTPGDEARHVPQPEPNVTRTFAPQQTDATFRVAGSAYSHASGTGDAVAVGVNTRNASNSDAISPITLLDPRTNQLVGKELTADTNDREGRVNVGVTENDQQMTVHVDLLNLTPMDVVTNIKYVDNEGFYITYRRLSAWAQGTDRVTSVPQTTATVVTEIYQDQDGMKGDRTTLHTFGTPIPTSPTCFDTFRICTWPKEKGGTIAWEQGQIQEVEQRWNNTAGKANPESPVKLQVYNTVRTIPKHQKDDLLLLVAPYQKQNSGGYPHQTSYFYGTRTDDMQVNCGNTTWMIIAMQDSKSCHTFVSLLAKEAQDLQGFQDETMRGLSYLTKQEIANGGSDSFDRPCLWWRPMGPTVFCSADDDWDKGSTGYVTVIGEDPQGLAPLETLEATNLSHDVQGGDECLVTQGIDGKWYMSEAPGVEIDVVTDVLCDAIGNLTIQKTPVMVMQAKDPSYEPRTCLHRETVDVISRLSISGTTISYTVNKDTVVLQRGAAEIHTEELHYPPPPPLEGEYIDVVTGLGYDTASSSLRVSYRAGVEVISGGTEGYAYLTLGELMDVVSDVNFSNDGLVKTRTTSVSVLKKGAPEDTTIRGNKVGAVTNLDVTEDGVVSWDVRDVYVVALAGTQSYTQELGTTIDVVSGLALDANGIKVTKKTSVKVLDPGADASDEIPGTPCP